MRLLLQRVLSASVTVGGEVVGRIDRGLLVFAAIEKGDGAREVEWAAKKLSGLRIFEDETGRMNDDLQAAEGSVLVVSQFTLAGSLRRGRRPSFDGAAPPELAEPLVEEFVDRLRNLGIPVETGRFRAHMQVELVNDGPVTFVLDVPKQEG